jgi:hypothetical protein
MATGDAPRIFSRPDYAYSWSDQHSTKWEVAWKTTTRTKVLTRTVTRIKTSTRTVMTKPATITIPGYGKVTTAVE